MIWAYFFNLMREMHVGDINSVRNYRAYCTFEFFMIVFSEVS